MSARELAVRATDDPLSAVDWLPPQRALLDHPARVKLLRSGNQAVGKTWAGLAECLLRAMGRDPRMPGRVAQEIWVVCAAWSQSIAIQQKLWELAPKRHVHPRQTFDVVRGFGGHTPALRLMNGAVIKIKTTQQGALNLSGATIDHAMFDEPPASERVFAEVRKRVQQRGGTVTLTLTPINAPTEWLRKLCESGDVVDLHFPLRPEYLIHTRSGRPRRLDDGTVCDASWIAQIRRESLPYEEPVVIDGEWEMRAVGRSFPEFRASGAGRHVHDEVPAGEVLLAFGTDHGLRAGRQSAVLVAITERTGLHPLVHVIDEYRPSTATTPEDDAVAILAMIRRHGLEWASLDYAWGDRPTGGRGDVARKGNYDIEDVLAKLMGLRRRDELKPRLASAKRGKDAGVGQPEAGARWIHHQMLRPGHFNVHPRCVHLIEALHKWAGETDSPHKDLIDALRYALRAWVLGTRRSTVRRSLVIG